MGGAFRVSIRPRTVPELAIWFNLTPRPADDGARRAQEAAKLAGLSWRPAPSIDVAAGWGRIEGRVSSWRIVLGTVGQRNDDR
jgi:hypothetical protein